MPYNDDKKIIPDDKQRERASGIYKELYQEYILKNENQNNKVFKGIIEIINEKSKNEFNRTDVKIWGANQISININPNKRTGIKKCLYDIKEGKEISLKTVQDKVKKFETLDDFLNYAEQYKNILSKLINNKLITNPTNKDNPLLGTKWYAYFLYYLNDPDSDAEEDQEAFLGRGVVSFNKFNIDNEENISPEDFWGANKELSKQIFSVKFENTDQENSVDYYGNFILDNRVGNGKKIIILNLYSAEIARQLHIKAYYNKSDQEIMLGMFTTYEDNRIQSGTILFHNTKNTTNITANSFSFRKNAQEFEKNIPSGIRDFFALKHRNYHRVFHRVTTLKSLARIESQFSMHKERFSLFLEKPIPEVFICRPDSLDEKNKAGADKIIEKLKRNFNSGIPIGDKQKIRLSINVNRFPGDDVNRMNGIPNPHTNIKAIKGTRYFIIFIDNKAMVNYGLILFSWSLIFSKVSFLVYKKDSVSNTILSLNNHPNVHEKLFYPIEFEGEITSSWEKICKEINDKMIYHINHNDIFDDDMKI